MLRAVSRAHRGRDRGAVSVRRWRRNRLRKKQVKSVLGECCCAAVVCFRTTSEQPHGYTSSTFLSR
ncbi:unnamed protein product [Ectocarpus sp. 12 AP-2014]